MASNMLHLFDFLPEVALRKLEWSSTSSKTATAKQFAVNICRGAYTPQAFKDSFSFVIKRVIEILMPVTVT